MHACRQEFARFLANNTNFHVNMDYKIGNIIKTKEHNIRNGGSYAA